MSNFKKPFVIFLIFLLSFTSILALFTPSVKAETWTDITLPYTITESGNYRIASPWNGSGIGLAINASDVVVDGQNYLINLTRTQGDNGVRINNGSQNVLLENLKVRNAYVGVHALSENFTVEDSNLNFNFVGLFANCSEHFDVLNCNLTFNLAVNFFAKFSSHFTIEGCNLNNGTRAGVVATYSDNFDFLNCKINNNPAGVLVRDAQNFTFTNCDIKNNTAIGFMAGLADNFTFTGCNLSNNTLSSTIASSNNFTIQNSILNNNAYGLVGVNVTNFVIENSNVNNNTLGGRLQVASHFSIQNSSYDNNFMGLEIMEAANFTVKDSSVNNTLLGLLTGDAGNFTIDGTKMTNNRQVNLEVVDSGNFTIQNNIMNSSRYGLLAIDNNNFAVQNCNLDNNTLFGLISAYNDNALITNNVFTGNGFNNEEDDIIGSGLIADDTNCTVTNNSFIGNNDALFWSVYDEEENNSALFYSNVFTNNNYTFFFDYELPNNFTNQKLFFYNNYVNDPAYVDPSSFNDSYSGPYLPFNPAVINFNTTVQAGARPYSNGRMIGGNYWAYPNGTGPSQTATDSNKDGFADAPFDLFGDGTVYDYLPYSSGYVSNFTFTAGTGQTLVVNQTSSLMTVQMVDYFGNVNSGITVNLSSNSSSGKFYSDEAGTQEISSVVIPAGSSTCSFYYKDMAAGSPVLTASAQDVTSATTNFTINAHSETVDYITISPTAATITAGTAINYTTTAHDQYGNSWNVTAAYTVDNIPISGNTIGTSVPGFYIVEATYNEKTSATTLTVTPGPVDHFAVVAPSSATQGSPFGITVAAMDSVGNIVTGFTGPVSLSTNQSSISPTTSGAFTAGIWAGSVTISDAGSVTVTAKDDSGHSGTSRAIAVSAPTPTPSPSPIPSSTIQATTGSGTTINIAIDGNITSSQISGVTISTNQSAATTTVSFIVTGQSGTTGFSNMTIPKSQIPYGTTPIIYIDGLQAQNQGYSQDDQNYYVWFTTSFSTHQVQILFTGEPSTSTPTVWYALTAIAVIAIAVAALALVLNRRKRKQPQ